MSTMSSSRSVAHASSTSPSSDGARPFLVAALAQQAQAGPDRARRRRHGDDARGRGPRRLARRLPPARARGRLPLVGDAAPRAALAAQRHRRPAPRRAATDRAPRPARHGIRPAVGGRRARARGAPAADQGARRPRAGRAAPRRRAPAARRRRRPRGGRLHPHRPRRAARRVRRARRHPRRLPADRGAPGPHRVLGRHRRGGALVQGRRPALARGRRPRPLGAPVP